MTVNVRESGGNKKGQKEGFGSIRKLPSGRYQALYTAPNKKVVTAPVTFDTLATFRRMIYSGDDKPLIQICRSFEWSCIY